MTFHPAAVISSRLSSDIRMPPPPPVINGNPKIAVVGGNGAYEGARGSITERELPKERTENTVHLLP